MSYSTFDRFQGAWLGSIIATNFLVNNTNQSQRSGVTYDPSSQWIVTRDKIGQNIIQTQKIDHRYIQDQLIQLLPESFSAILALLPLIFFQETHQKTPREFINQCNLKLGNTTEIVEDILIWSYLLTLIFKNRLESENINVSTLVKRVIAGVEVKTTSRLEQLGIVRRAWSNGSSLGELTEKLCLQENLGQNATAIGGIIPLSLYCFASTPKHFMLSVKRASSINTNLSAAIVALTATMSGAYNGIASIPRNWKHIARNDRVYRQGQKTAEQLFQTWLGTHSPPDIHQLSYDTEINAVAVPQIIQHRQALTIISQKHNLS